MKKQHLTKGIFAQFQLAKKVSNSTYLNILKHDLIKKLAFIDMGKIYRLVKKSLKSDLITAPDASIDSA